MPITSVRHPKGYEEFLCPKKDAEVVVHINSMNSLTSRRKVDPSNEEGIAKIVADVQKHIARTGYAVIKVDNAITYTVGSPLGYDLAITGLPADIAHTIINLAVEILAKYEKKLQSCVGNEAGQLCLILKGVLLNNVHLYGVMVGEKPANYIRERPSHVIQLVYPDSNGNYPWNSGYMLTGQHLMWESMTPSRMFILDRERGLNQQVTPISFPSSKFLAICGFNGSLKFRNGRIVKTDYDGDVLDIPSGSLKSIINL